MKVGINISELSNLRQVVWALMLGFLFFGPKAQAQNLVKNPSFEETNNWMSGNKLQKGGIIRRFYLTTNCIS
jgi:hypothetical protein